MTRRVNPPPDPRVDPDGARAYRAECIEIAKAALGEARIAEDLGADDDARVCRAVMDAVLDGANPRRAAAS